MPAKAIKMQAKITRPTKETIKQLKLSPTSQGFPQWSRHPVAGGATSSDDGGGSCRASCVRCVVCWEGFLDLIIKL